MVLRCHRASATRARGLELLHIWLPSVLRLPSCVGGHGCRCCPLPGRLEGCWGSLARPTRHRGDAGLVLRCLRARASALGSELPHLVVVGVAPYFVGGLAGWWGLSFASCETLAGILWVGAGRCRRASSARAVRSCCTPDLLAVLPPPWRIGGLVWLSHASCEIPAGILGWCWALLQGKLSARG